MKVSTISPVSYRSYPQNSQTFTGNEKPNLSALGKTVSTEKSGLGAGFRKAMTFLGVTFAALFGSSGVMAQTPSDSTLLASNDSKAIVTTASKTTSEVATPYVVADTTIIFGEGKNSTPVKFSLLRLNGANDGYYDAAAMEYLDVDPLRRREAVPVRKELTALGRDSDGGRFYMFGPPDGNSSVYKEFEPLMNFFKSYKSKLSLNSAIRFIKQ